MHVSTHVAYRSTHKDLNVILEDVSLDPPQMIYRDISLDHILFKIGWFSEITKTSVILDAFEDVSL